MADLLVKAGRRQNVDADVRAVPREVIGLAALGEIGGDAPMIGVDPLDMAGPAQRLQPADMGADEGLGIAAERSMATSARSRCGGRAIDAALDRQRP